MNKIFLIALLTFILPIGTSAGIVVEQNAVIVKDFEVKTLEFFKVGNTDDTLLNFETINVSESVDHWKLLVSCDDKISIYFLPDSNKNICGGYVKITEFKDNKFNLIFRNENSDKAFKNFSFRLKAYDENDKWLQTERKAFKWK